MTGSVIGCVKSFVLPLSEEFILLDCTLDKRAISCAISRAVIAWGEDTKTLCPDTRNRWEKSSRANGETLVRAYSSTPNESTKKNEKRSSYRCGNAQQHDNLEISNESAERTMSSLTKSDVGGAVSKT